MVTRCGESDRARLLPSLVALGLPVTCLDGESTSTFAFRYEGDVRHFEIVAVGDSWSPAEARELRRGPLAGVEWLHVGPVLRSEFPPETLEELASGRRLSYDGHGLVRRPEPGPLHLDADFDPAAAPARLDPQARRGGGASPPPGRSSPRRWRRSGRGRCSVTFGSRGALVVVDGKAERVEAHPVLDADPTGSGDAFAAGYLASRSAGLAPVAAARRATSLVGTLLLAGRRR